MLVKGIIQPPTSGINNQYSADTTVFNVRIPLFESHKGSDPFIVKAIACTEPNTTLIYNVDDVVIIGFENNNLSKPIIIGKLYTEPAQKEISSLMIEIEKLKVELEYLKSVVEEHLTDD